MKNLTIALKRFIANKNTITFLCIIGAVLVLTIGYNYRINAATSPVVVAYAKVTIQPKTEITEEQIGYKQVPASAITSNVIVNANLIEGKYTNYNTIIPQGSLFYKEAIVSYDALPDAAFSDIKEGYTVYNFPIDMQKSYGNSLFPGNLIDIYFKAVNDSGEIMYGQLYSDVKILAVKDSKGDSVFKNSDELGTPSMLLFAVPNDMYLILKKAAYLTTSDAELVIVPESVKVDTDPTITSSYLVEFIKAKTAIIPQDKIDSAYNETIEETVSEETTETTE